MINSSRHRDEEDEYDDEDAFDDDDNVDRNHSTDDEQHVRQAATERWEAEKQLYCRFGKFVLLMGIFWSIIFFAEIEHDDVIAMIGLACFGLWLFYMLAAIVVSTVSLYRQQHALEHILTEEELNANDLDGNDEEVGDGDQRIWTWSFDETPRRIRATRDEVGALAARPTSGLYKIVCSAVYFGKTIRTESQMQFQFVNAKHNNNGWELQGFSMNSSSTNKAAATTNRSIADGFLNARGEMYWILNNSDHDTTKSAAYRGFFDVATNSMFDGEFQAGVGPTGRIVMMQLVKATTEATGTASIESNGSRKPADVEMVELNKRIV